MLSYWEKNTWLSHVDVAIIGSGLVGLLTAIFLKQQRPKLKVVVFERGILPSGASTKNAGFACYGSLSEFHDDVEHFGLDKATAWVERRYSGWLKLHQLLGSERMGHEPFGGTEFFFSNQQELATTCIAHMEEYNNALLPIFKSKAFLTGTDPSALGTRGISSAVALPNEGQIDPGKTMFSLLQLAHQLGVIVLSGCGVLALSETPTAVSLQTDVGDVKAQFVQVCTNGFAQQLFPILDVQPARAQVVVTSPIPNLPYKGVFHLDRGYYYFRNIGNRLLLGGGRHLDFKAERTFSLETSERLMSHLKELLEQYLLPKFNFSIEHQWAGTMGFGSSNEKEVLAYPLSERIRCNVRLGGMGVALSAHVAEQAAQATPSI